MAQSHQGQQLDTLQRQQILLLHQIPRFANNPVRFLGGGQCGHVYLVHDANSDGQHRAVKLIPREQININHIREILNHYKLSGHVHIIGFCDVFLYNRYLCIVMEFADKGTVLAHITDVISKMGSLEARESEALLLFRQLIIALDYIHSKGVSFRDIKPDNLLLQSTQLELPPSTLMLKYCDFGFSKDENNSAAKTSDAGTYAYMAPEVLRAEKYEGKRVDVWSCGVVLYTMLYGKFPFLCLQDGKPCRDHWQTVQMYNEMTQEHINNKLNALPGSKGVKALMKRMLVLDHNHRITVKQILEEPWFKQSLTPGQIMYNSYPDPDPDTALPHQEITAIHDFLHRLAPAGSELAIKIRDLLDQEAKQQEQPTTPEAVNHHQHSRFLPRIFKAFKGHDKQVPH